MGKREIVKKRKQQQKSKESLAIILIIAAFAIVIVGMVILTNLKPNQQTATATSQSSLPDIVVPEFHQAAIVDGLTMGSPDAPVIVTEFADFQCPACGGYWKNLEPTIIANYVNTGKVQFIYNPFSFLGQGQKWDESVNSAKAAYCANEEGKFWPYHDMIFANQYYENMGSFSRDRLIAFAEKIGLNIKNFTDCLDSTKYDQQVQDATQAASKAGSTYTPSFSINGNIVSANELIQAIEDALK